MKEIYNANGLNLSNRPQQTHSEKMPQKCLKSSRYKMLKCTKTYPLCRKKYPLLKLGNRLQDDGSGAEILGIS
jgi:hypothetical protein